MRNDSLAFDAPTQVVSRPNLAVDNPANDFRLSAVSSQKIISGFRKTWVKLRMRSSIVRILLRHYRNPAITIDMLIKLMGVRRAMLGKQSINKFARANGRWFCDLYTPGIGSKAFQAFVESEANRIMPLRTNANRFVNVFVAITKQCPYRCEHCFEWDELNKAESLNADSLKLIVEKVLQMGTSQIQFTGGEPLTRIETLVELVKMVPETTETWVITSGNNLTVENAQKLKAAGLTGIVVSLDSADPATHNRFRGSNQAFSRALDGAINSISAGLVTAFSLCASKEFISEENLMAYADLARQTGVAFIQLLEPRSAGHWQGKDVELSREKEMMLENFYQKMNYDKRFGQYPIVCYIARFNRRSSCMSSGDRNLYIDTNGDLQVCPFCRINKGSFLSPGAESEISSYQAQGCPEYGRFRL